VRIQTRHVHIRCLHRILEFIRSSERGPIRVADLAKVAGLSQFHLNRVFRAQTGESLADFVRRVRLERAAFQLRTCKLSVAQIAADAGYGTGETFSRSFKRAYGATPSEFRQASVEDFTLQGASGIHWNETGCPCTLQLPGTELPVTILSLPAIPLVAFRFVGDYAKCWQAWQTLRDHIERRISIDESTRFYTIYHDDYATYEPDSLRLDLCISWQEDDLVPHGGRPLQLPAGIYAASASFIPLAETGKAWQSLTDVWLPRNGTRPVNVPCLDEYESWPTPFEQSAARLYIGLEVDFGDPGVIPPLAYLGQSASNRGYLEPSAVRRRRNPAAR
jgi:AraC family transcriptional regulator